MGAKVGGPLWLMAAAGPGRGEASNAGEPVAGEATARQRGYGVGGQTRKPRRSPEW
jgi:hypothetical protein